MERINISSSQLNKKAEVYLKKKNLAATVPNDIVSHYLFATNTSCFVHVKSEGGS